MTKFTLHDIDTSTIDKSLKSYNQLITLYNDNKNNFFEILEISYEKWFAANMSSALGGILDKLIINLNMIQFGIIPDAIKTIIQKNAFLSHYGYDRIYDINNTTIKFIKMKPTDGRFFHSYVVAELLNRPELPGISVALKKKIAESIYEIFVTHKFIVKLNLSIPVANFIQTCIKLNLRLPIPE